MAAMGQKRRDQAAGTYHVCNHAIAGAPLFADEGDRLFRLDQLSDAVQEGAVVCHAFCLLGTHEHLLLTFEDETIACALQKLNRNYAVAFNSRHGRAGHVFKGRYFGKRMESDAHLLQTFRYIALNPERHGAAGRAELWPWSSYPGLVGQQAQFPFVDSARIVAALGPGRAAVERIRAFVDDGRLLAAAA
jgi:REP element-mobilizing transposase RayT